MRVGWLHDRGHYIGGAELTQVELAAAAPAGVELVDCPPGKVDRECERYLIHNCVTYDLADLDPIRRAPAFKYWNDVGSWYHDEVRILLDQHAVPIYCSPLQEAYMNPVTVPVRRAAIPPPVNLAAFENAAANVNGDRRGAVSVGSWRNLGKGPQRAAAWAQQNQTKLAFFGGGPFAPPGSQEIAYAGMPQLLAGYETFVFLPAVIEPFGRVVAEAWAAGCEIVTNNLVGAKYWIEEAPDAIRTAATDYWDFVLA